MIFCTNGQRNLHTGSGPVFAQAPASASAPISGLRLLCLLLLCVLTLGTTANAQQQTQLLTTQLNALSRDMFMSRQAIEQEGGQTEAALAALAKETDSSKALQRTLSELNSPEEIQRALEALRVFGYRVQSEVEQQAAQQSLDILEQRLKYLIQSENPQLTGLLAPTQALRKEIAARETTESPLPGARTRTFAERATTNVAANTAQTRTAGPPLGVTVKNGNTVFAVYAPAATDMQVVVFNKAADKDGRSYKMLKDVHGVWSTTLPGELFGKFYGYRASGPNTGGHLFDPQRLLSDPYAKANVDHDGKSIIVKTDFTWTDQNFRRPKHEDIVVYEMHIKDFTAHASSAVPAALRGTYLGMLYNAGPDKLIAHLKDLGVNAVELLPVHEFDNNFAGHPNHWGYMTSHFFAPETSFASGKEGQAVVEFKKLVNALHRAGIAVIMDVVYNHTAEGNEQGTPLNFKGLNNPGYYRLTDNPKYYWNGTGCGNEFKSEDPMTRKFIVDSLKYWHHEFHIDGFRFDLGTILDKTTFNEILKQLPASTYIMAEPWAADWKRNQWGKSDFRNTRMAKWNDDFREKIRAFCSGSADRNEVMTVLAGSCFWWAAKPTESLNYVECHDGYTVADLFQGDVRKCKLAALALLTGQGIPMVHAGQEFMKSKKGNHNSYDQDNEINWIDWRVKSKNADFYAFFKGLVALRHKYPNFRHKTALNNQSINWLLPANQKGVGYHLKGEKDIIVLLNGDQSQWISFPLPPGKWTKLCDGERVDLDGKLGEAEGTYNLPEKMGVVLVR